MDEEEGPTDVYRAVCCRKAGSRIFHSLLAILFFFVMTATLTSLGVFAAKHNDIAGELAGDSNCILYTTKNELEDGELSSGVGCRFSIWGSAVVAVGTGLFMLGYIIKTTVGASLLSCLVALELPLLLLLLIVSFAVSVNTTLGLALACKGFEDYGSVDYGAGGSCKDFSAVKEKKVRFFDNILISETLSWSVTGALLLALLLYCVFCVVYCKRCTGSSDEHEQPLLEEKRKLEERKRKRVHPKQKGSLHSSTDHSDNPFL